LRIVGLEPGDGIVSARGRVDKAKPFGVRSGVDEI